jgi:putative inorganic carbon (HCO3(-)) transporter
MSAQESSRAYWPLIVVGGLTIFAPLIEGGTTHLPVLIIRLILLGAFVVWLLRSMRTGWIAVQQTPIFSVMVVFVGWAAVSVVRSSYLAPGLQWLISLCSYAVCLFLVVHLVQSVWEVRGLVPVLLGMGVFEAALGLYQFLWGGPARPTGTFFNANFFASYETAVFAVAFGLLCYRRPTEGFRWETPLLWLAAGADAVAFILAQSRGALLAFVAAVACVGLYRFGKPFLAVIVLGLIVGAIVQNPLQQRVLTVGAQDPYAYTRLAIWKNSLERISDHPWGVGLGLYKYMSFQYRFPVETAIARFGKRAESAHNEYLQVAVELGVLGLVLFLSGVSLLGWEIRETMRLPLEPWERGLVIGLSGGILGILVHGGVDAVFHEPALILLAILFAGLILVVKRLRQPQGSSIWTVPFPYHPVRAVAIGVGAVLCALLIVQPAAAWYAFEKGTGEAAVGREDKALDWLQRATLIDPGTTAYRDALALTEVRLFQQSGDPQWWLRGVENLTLCLELNPLDGRFAYRLGMLHVLLADRVGPRPRQEDLWRQAAAYFEQGIRLDPYSPFNYYELGKLRRAQGRKEEALALFRRAIGYEPNFLPARAQLAELSLQIGQRDIAKTEYEQIVKVKERYRGWTLTALERQFLEVDTERVKRSLSMVAP